MDAARHTLGGTVVTAVQDAVGSFYLPAREAFPAADEEAWRAARLLDPEAFGPEDEWRLRFRCFLIRPDGGPTVLVDCGIGPVGAPAGSWLPVPGRLPTELTALGVEAADVDVVVLTHLHSDHIGWAVYPEDRRPYFPNARYVLQQAEYDAVLEYAPVRKEALLDPLRATGQLHLVDGEARLAAGVRTALAPGHTPGHQAVFVSHGDDTLLITGDVLVHAVQLADPTVAYADEIDPDVARTTRQTLLRQATHLATSHLTAPFHKTPTT
jgi:glyoxylase-like metal-dependent hydrolase (beta-lactamase superfamily II)